MTTQVKSISMHSAPNINRPNTRRDVSGVRHAVFTTQATQLSCFRQTQLKSKDSKNKSASGLAVFMSVDG